MAIEGRMKMRQEASAHGELERDPERRDENKEEMRTNEASRSRELRMAPLATGGRAGESPQNEGPPRKMGRTLGLE